MFNISELWPKHKKHSCTCVHSVEKATDIGATWPHMNKPIMEHCHCHVVTSAFLQGEVFNDTGIHFWHVLIHKILILIITIVKSCILITSFLGQTKKSDFRASRVYSAKKNPFFSPDISLVIIICALIGYICLHHYFVCSHDAIYPTKWGPRSRGFRCRAYHA